MKKKTVLGLYTTRKGNVGIEVVQSEPGYVQVTGHWVHRKVKMEHVKAKRYVAMILRRIGTYHTEVAFHE